MRNVLVLLLLALTRAEEWKGFASSNNLFASSLYKQILKDTNGNFLVSPLSAELVLALVQFGARNETAEELRAALYLPQDQEALEDTLKSFIPPLLQNEKYSLHLATKMYLKQDCHLKNEFLRVAKEVFSSEVEAIDFSQTVEAAHTMNKWVEERTRNKIKELIDPNVLDRNTKAVLINALHFQGDWLHPFGLRLTQMRDFHRNSGRVVKVATMQMINGFFDYYENHQLKAKFLEMPFGHSDASMVFVLPNDEDGLSLLEEQMDKVLLPQKLRNSFIHVSLPKFKMESQFDFTDILKKLGVISAFDENKANLSGISEDKLHISKVAQKSFIVVNEGGVEAASASYDVIMPRAYALLHFKADHPFIFYIKVKGVIIFVGRVVEPEFNV